MINMKYAFNLSVLMLSTYAQAQSLNFNEVWEKALSQSPEISARKQETLANKYSLNRAKLHWLPELGLKASAYSTNDPASNFFGILSQRSVQAQDFSPASLNTPGYHSFQNIILGLDLPLYEGGRKAELVEAQGAQHEVSSLMLKLKKRELFTKIFQDYGHLITDQNTKLKLNTLKEQVLKILSRYAIGNESNPVGYSGMLGLKGISNRIDAELVAIDTSEKNHQISLAEKTNLGQDQIVPSEKQVKEINPLIKNLVDSPIDLDGSSISEDLAIQKENILIAYKNAERSRFLPKIGLFGNESLTHGARDTGTATTVGIYLAWSLYSPDHTNRIAEQSALKEAAGYYKEQSIKDTRIARKSLNENERALEKTLKILSESDQILSEQTKVATRLFQSGSISALQLAEVYNRRTDLILNLRQNENSWVEVKAKKMTLINTKEDRL